MELFAFLSVTLAAHAAFAAGVALQARREGADPRKWAGVTLLFGLGGIAGYLLLADR